MKLFTVSALFAFAAATQAMTFTATFDEFSEGHSGVIIESGGVRFDGLNSNLSGGGEVFTIEASNSGDLGSSFTPPNALGFLGYVPGTGTAFGRFQHLDIGLVDTAYTMQTIRLDMYTFLLQAAGNTVTLAGYRNSQLVDSITYTPSTFVVDHRSLALASGDYDKFSVFSAGSVDTGVVFALFDNVAVEATPVPEPMSIVVLGLGLSGLVRRRRAANSRIM